MLYRQGTSEYSACIWGQELTTELSKLPLSSKEEPSSSASSSTEVVARLAVAAELKKGIDGLWRDRGNEDVFGGE